MKKTSLLILLAMPILLMAEVSVAALSSVDPANPSSQPLASPLSLSEATTMATDYYPSIGSIMAQPDDEVAVARMLHLMSLVGVDRNGHPLGQEFRIPNDIALFSQAGASPYAVLPLPTYMNNIITVL